MATREPLRLLPFQLHEWQFITSGTVCPPHEPVVIWVQLSNSRKRNQSRGCEKINVRSARDQKVTWPNQLPKASQVPRPLSLKTTKTMSTKVRIVISTQFYHQMLHGVLQKNNLQTKFVKRHHTAASSCSGPADFIIQKSIVNRRK